jgi:predicted SAM-dependent methyltransferase
VGCGPKRKDRTTKALATWNELRFDIDETVEPDLVGTMTDMSSVSSESVDGVFSSHNIEHLYPQQQDGQGRQTGYRVHRIIPP